MTVGLPQRVLFIYLSNLFASYVPLNQVGIGASGYLPSYGYGDIGGVGSYPLSGTSGIKPGVCPSSTRYSGGYGGYYDYYRRSGGSRYQGE